MYSKSLCGKESGDAASQRLAMQLEAMSGMNISDRNFADTKDVGISTAILSTYITTTQID